MVVLPAPLGPTSADNCPAWISKDRSRSAQQEVPLVIAWPDHPPSGS